jgi:predicted transcriptional regulator
MPDSSVKQRALEAVRALPETATFEDVMERLLFLAKIDRGLADVEAGRVIPHEQVKAKYGL